jgi:hypothetical protein
LSGQKLHKYGVGYCIYANFVPLTMFGRFLDISANRGLQIKGLLVIDVKHRMTAAECLQHAWFGPVVPASVSRFYHFIYPTDFSDHHR